MTKHIAQAHLARGKARSACKREGRLRPLAQRVLIAAAAVLTASAGAQGPYATRVVTFTPAPGQFVNDPLYRDPNVALGWPAGGNPSDPDNGSQVSLGGFGGRIVLAFDSPVLDDPTHPFGLDAIVFGNAYWIAGDAARRWTEAATIEISRDANGNGLADDPWYLVPGSHVGTPGFAASYVTKSWDDNLDDGALPPLWPPADETWIPPGVSGTWTTSGYVLPGAVFNPFVTQNPAGSDPTRETVWGYADVSPGAARPDDVPPEMFFTRPDNPLVVGLTLGSAGGDAFDIAWAVDPATWQPAGLDGFDFLRLTTAVDMVFVSPPLGEKSTEVDAVVAVAAGTLGDTENDGDVDLDDAALLVECLSGPDDAAPTVPCRVLGFDADGDVDLFDVAEFQVSFTGAAAVVEAADLASPGGAP